MIRSHNKKFYLLSLLLLPLTGFADVSGVVNFFTPPSGDISVFLIASIFGTVGGVIHGTGTQLVGQVMGVFCNGIVIAVGGVFSYNIFKLVLHSAQEGEMMAGKGRQLGITMLRSVVGLSLSAPSVSTGYCMAQTIAMWLVIQGIGFADQTWNKVVDYLSNGGNLYQITQTGSADVNDMASMAPPMIGILQAEVCTAMLSNQLNQSAAANSAVSQQVSSALGLPASNIPSTGKNPAGFAVNDNGGSANFGTQNTRYPADGVGGGGVVGHCCGVAV